MVCLIISMRRVFNKFSKDLITYFLSMHCHSVVTLGGKITSRSEGEHTASIACHGKSTESDLQHYMQNTVTKSD